MNLVVAGQDLTITAHKLGALESVRIVADGNRETSAQNHHLVAARHGYEKARGLFSKSRSNLQPPRVITNKRKVFRQADQLSATACGEIDLFLGSGEVAIGIGAARELHGRSQEITHRGQSSVAETVLPINQRVFRHE